MGDLNNPVPVLKEAAARYPVGVRKVALAQAAAVYTETIAAHGGSTGPSALRDALETSLKALHRTARAAVAKSEADAVAPVSSHGWWDTSNAPTATQASNGETRTLEAQGIAAAAARRMEQFGEDPNDEVAMARAINAVMEDHSYGRTSTFETLSARSAASARETGWAWPADMNDSRQVEAADEINSALKPEGADGISGRRNDPRAVASPMPATTGFSGTGTPSFPPGVIAGDVAKRK